MISKQMIVACALALDAFIGGGAYAAPDAAEKARLFGAREAVEQASLSPDGLKVAFVQPMAGQGAGLYIADLRGTGQIQLKRIVAAQGNPERIQWCRWASNSRLLCNIYGISRLQSGEIAYLTRLIALDSDGANMKTIGNKTGSGLQLREALYGGEVIDWSPGEDGHVLMMREYVPEQTIGTRNAQTKDGVGVDDVDTVTLQSRPLEKPRPDAAEYISDGKGIVRIMGMRKTGVSGYATGARRYSYRSPGDREWKELSLVDDTGDTFDPHAVDSTLNIAYGLKDVNGRAAAFSKALDGGGTETLIFAHPQVEVDGFIRLGRNRRVIGASYATDKREVEYFDPAMAKLARALAKSFPNLPLVRFIDSSEDETTLLIWAGSDTEPGRYYLLNRKTNHMEELTADRPELTFPLSKVKAVSYPTADGTMIPAYLTLPPTGADKGLPAIVMPHGGPAARDEWGFDWLAQYFAGQGYAVLQPNFRGSAGYGDHWFQKNGFQDWRTAIGDVDDGGRWLIKEGIARPDGLAIFGWSYGGYAALQSAVTEPGLFKAVIAVAPVTDLDRLREERRFWGDYQIVNRYIGTGPHVAAGSPARHADQVKVPVLMFHGTLDRNVGVSHARLMDDRLKAAGASSQLVIYDDRDHYLQDSGVRADMLTKSVSFLDKALAITP